MSRQLKVAHLLVSGDIGGVETLNLNAAKYSKNVNIYFFLFQKGIIYEEMVSRGYRCEFIGTSKRKYLNDCLKIARIIRKERIDALICHFNNPFIALCTLCVRLLRPEARIIGYMHCSPDDYNRKMLICAKIIFHQANKIICISDYVLNSVKKYFGYDNKLVRIYNGVDVSKFSCTDITTKKTGHKFVYVGRLIEKKGVQNILKSLAKTKDIPYIFQIVGEGSYRKELEKLTYELGIDNKVKFLGMRRDIPELLWDSDVFIHLPEWQEGFGITVIEAMAAGLICIVNDHGALPEIVQDGISGFVIHDIDGQFGKIINNIVRSSNEYKLGKMRNASIMRAENFSIQKYSEKLDSVIEDKQEVVFFDGKDSFA